MLDEFLTAKTWVHRHEKHHVNILDDVFEHVDGGMRIERHTSLHASIVYLLDRAMQMGTCFVMRVHHVSAKGFDLLSELARVNNHQVDIKRFLANLGDSLKDGKSETDVGHENAVHYIEVEPVGFTTVNHVDVLCQIGKVGS